MYVILYLVLKWLLTSFCIKVYKRGWSCPDSSSVVSHYLSRVARRVVFTHEDDWRRIKVKSVFFPVIYFSDYLYNIYNQ